MTPNPLFDLSGRVALVTGASKGLGRAMALGLAQAGASLALCARDAEGLAASRAEAEQHGVRAETFGMDVTSRQSVRDAVAAALARFGRIDVLLNDAGVNLRKPALEFSEDEWDRVVDTNLKGYFLVAQAVGEHMVASGGGKIINVGSILGTVGMKNQLPYASSKGGVAQLTRVLAVEWAPHRVYVNAIAPGFFETPLTAGVLQNPEVRRFVAERTPMGRWGQPAELQGAAVFLASRASDFVTGQILHVDGGWTVW
jgi:NAD(P)-dependent dehydrogenase (short-subunit alcohol dehydrogenase family)